MAEQDAPPAAERSLGPVMPSRRVRVLVGVAWFGASALFFMTAGIVPSLPCTPRAVELLSVFKCAWLPLALGMAVSLAGPLECRARMFFLALAALAASAIVAGDVWLLARARVLAQMAIRQDGSLAMLSWTAGELARDVRYARIGIAWHMAGYVLCFGGAAAWFAWLMRFRAPEDADFD